MKDPKIFDQKTMIFMFNYVTKLGPGKQFGEVGISSGEIRSAMIVSKVSKEKSKEKRKVKLNSTAKP